jgi:membrane-associated protein
MEWLSELFRNLTDIPALIKWAGYVGLTAIIFAETGLLVGFFLPGDSLLVTAGLLISQGFPLDLVKLGSILTVAAIVGDTVNYWFGVYTGPRIFKREDSLLFKKKHVYRAQAFYDKHGGKTIILARFMPIIRTFAPLVAGVAGMEYKRFMAYNVFGGILWIWSMLLTGYYLGRMVPGIDKYIEIVIIVVIFLSILPGIISWWRNRGQVQAVQDSDKAAKAAAEATR